VRFSKFHKNLTVGKSLNVMTYKSAEYLQLHDYKFLKNFFIMSGNMKQF